MTGARKTRRSGQLALGQTIRRLSQRSGLTLIEIAMVLSIAVTVGGLVLWPAQCRQRSMNSTEHHIRSTLRQARQTAQSTGLPVEIKISKADRTLRGVITPSLWPALRQCQVDEHQALPFTAGRR